MPARWSRPAARSVVIASMPALVTAWASAGSSLANSIDVDQAGQQVADGVGMLARGTRCRR